MTQLLCEYIMFTVHSPSLQPPAFWTLPPIAHPVAFTKEERIFDTILFVVKIVLPPLLILFGLFGNLLSFLVLSQPQHAKQTTCFYMRVLSVFDSLILILKVSLRTAINYNPDVLLGPELWPYICPANAFVNCTFGFSNWTIAAMTFDRFIAVKFPLKAASLCTIHRCKISVSINFTFSFLLTIPHSLRNSINNAANVQREICTVSDPFPPWWDKTMALIHSTILFTVPFFTILIFNILIIITLIEQRMQSVKLQVQNVDKKEGHITIMLFIITIIFFVTNIPWSIDQWIWDLNLLDSGDWIENKLRKVVYEIEVFFLFVNPSVNFYIYCLACRKFREHIRTLLCNCFKCL
jgi:hypothetical protein